MRRDVLLTALCLALAGGADAAQAGPNIALSSAGASFVSASSALNPIGLTPINGGQLTADANLLTTTPTVWLNDNDSRYLFSDSDSNESAIINLGSEQSLQSFGATWFTSVYHDRAPTSFAVLLSTNGTNFTLAGTAGSLPYGGGGTLLSLSVPVQAMYVEYEFGGSGSGIDEVFADVSDPPAYVPEPPAAALLVAGLTSLVVMSMRRGRSSFGL